MLDIKFIRENPDIVKKAVKDKQLADTVDVDELLKVEKKYRGILQSVETHRALRNQLSENISKVEEKEREKLIDEATKVKKELAEFEEELNKVKGKLDYLLGKVPNLVSDDVPVGKDESENVVIRTWGEPTKFDFEPKDHIELGEALDLIDIETSAKVSGSRFNYLKNEAVFLQFALINFAMATLTDKKIISKLAKETNNLSHKTFTTIIPPVILKAEVAKKMDRFDPIEDRYYFEGDDVLLAGSAEHTLGPMHMDETLDEKNLPVRYVGYSTAFRREAGTYGKDTKGILRRHQFDKVEMVMFSMPENGLTEQNLAVAIQEYIVQQLEIPYQVINICTGDMGRPDYRQIDVECWMPGQNKYRETHTSDYMTDYQSRRLNTKFKSEKGETGYVHMNDATVIAIGRTLIALLENYQQKDGSVKIPKVLHPYMNGLTEIKKGNRTQV